MSFLKNKKILNSIILGIKNGMRIPTLPVKINKIYNHIYFRIIRVIGGICLILNLTKFYLNFPDIFQYLILAFSLFQIIQILIIFTIKLIYGIYTLIYKSKEFEVRNSP